MLEVMFLGIIGLIWIVFAVIQDLKKREIANWLNFSLILFALTFRFFYSFFENQNYHFFYQGLFGFVFFFLIGNLLYYGRIFAGGDAKLMIALGTVIPFSSDSLFNISVVFSFFILFLIVGAGYGIVFSLILGIKNKRAFVNEFSKEFEKKRNIFHATLFLSLLFLLFSFFFREIFILAIFILIFPYLYVSAKSIDEVCMVKRVNSQLLTEGDWLCEDVKIGRRIIKVKWEGLSREEIVFLKKKKKNILIKQGIPFSPVFLFSYLILIYLITFQKILFLF